MNIDTILEKFRHMSPTVREQGKLFEKFVREYLRQTPTYDFTDVWLWKDWPLREGMPDTGIDLVAKTAEGEYWAIQCKFYEESSRVSKGDMDSFLSASSRTFTDEAGRKQQFAYRPVVATCDLSSTARSTLENQVPPAGTLYVRELEDTGIDWSLFWEQFDKNVLSGEDDGTDGHVTENVRSEKKKLRPHQQKALNDVLAGFQQHDRGKLIMACGTGKTFTSLRIAEQVVGGNGVVLYLVPSLSLLAQTLKAWSVDAEHRIRPVLVCSDIEIHKQDTRRKKSLADNDEPAFFSADLAQPATTDPKQLLARWQKLDKTREGMTVVFSTYHSIDVICKAQKKGFPAFDLIVCDEAHRTTGITLAQTDESAFVKVHNNANIQGKKRLYMTATPRVYGESAKTTVKKDNADNILCSMDDETLFGPEFHRLEFGAAVSQHLLADYKVIVLAVDEKYAEKVSASLESYTDEPDGKDKPAEIDLDDRAKIIGCWQGLSKQGKHVLKDGSLSDDFSADPEPMRRAVAFCKSIKISRDIITPAFTRIVDSLADSETTDGTLRVEMQHIDGTFGADLRQERLAWLKDEPQPGVCRILSNVRCLSEGVDVPSLDAVLFLSPRNSEVDVVQSVGRVMRIAPGKKFGYVILPIVVPFDQEPETVLNNNQKYQVVWQVLQALRSHDERFRVTINQIKYNEKLSNGPISFIGVGGDGGEAPGTETLPVTGAPEIQKYIPLEYEKAILARIVKKCGDKDYLEEWAKDIAQITQEHVRQIEKTLEKPTSIQKEAFARFVHKLQAEINPSIDDAEAIELLTQHMATRPVFDALFGQNAFVKKNAVSQAFQHVLDTLDTTYSPEEKQKLEGFYLDIRRRVDGITSADGKQKVITNLYEQFFKTAFPKLVEKLGIVYTPIELVDFIIHSVEYVLKTEFNRRLTNPSVHVLDPFTGTGTFIVQLLKSGLIEPKDLRRKFLNELHANEIVLLAYYIAAVNIEETYREMRCQDAKKPSDYEPFPGIVLTDTFQMNERPLPEDEYQADLTDEQRVIENNERIRRQRKRTIEVIIGNPPYSVGQGSANDNNQNQKYPLLDSRIQKTYAAHSTAALQKGLYDSYIKAFRWASDRIEKNGVVAFVTNGGYIDGNAMSGFRKCLGDEFTSVYVFNLRGAVRGRSGDSAKREGQNVFNIMTGVAITILVKNPTVTNKNQSAKIFYHDIGDYHNRDAKLAILRTAHDIGNMQESDKWMEIQPNEHHDWINQRNVDFQAFIPLGDKKGESETADGLTFFEPIYSLGIATNRDAWAYNFSREDVGQNMERMINFYNSQIRDYTHALLTTPELNVEKFICRDATKISWTDLVLRDMQKGLQRSFIPTAVCQSLYRPFCKQYLYNDKNFLQRTYQIPKIFPTPKTKNIVICVPGHGARREFSVLISDNIPDLNFFDAGTQCFPLYYYTPSRENDEQRQLLDAAETIDGYERHDAVTDAIFEECQKRYGHFRPTTNDGKPLKNPPKLTKEAIFYYVYGLLHSPAYREAFAADLKKMLARLPLVKEPAAFFTFSRIGRELAELHLNYETAPLPHIVTVEGLSDDTPPEHLRVTKMTFAKKKILDDAGKQKTVDDKSVLHYNAHITLRNIPLDAYNYVVNGKSALDWIIERYAVTTHKDSGITNDPNLYSPDPRYILNLFLRVITVSLKTLELVNELATIDITPGEGGEQREE